MFGQGNVPFKAKLTVIMVTMVVLILYFLSQGHQGDVRWVAFQNRFAYAAYGEFGTAGHYEIRLQRTVPQPGSAAVDTYPKFYKSLQPLEKSLRLQPLSIQQIQTNFGDISKLIFFKHYFYAVDPSKGIKIFNNENMYAPWLIAQYDFYGIRDIAIFDDLAFIAAGKNGIYLLDIRDPSKPQIIDHYDTSGFTERILPVKIETSVGDFDVQSGQVERTEETNIRYIAYVADGESGLLLVDFISDQPDSSFLSVLKTIETPGYAHDVFYKDAFVFLADGSQGLHVFDALQSGEDPTNPRHLGTIDTPGEAQQVIFYRNYLFIADGESGLFTVQFLYRGNTLEIVSTDNLPVAGGAFALDIDKDIALLASGSNGMTVADIANPSQPSIRYQLNTPGIATTGQILEAYLGNAAITPKINQSVRDIIKELSFALALLVVFLIFLSPFALPYSDSREFWRSADDFLKYLTGSIGRAVLVENGQLLADPALQDYSKHRPLILDNASAGLIMGSDGEMRVVGPGTDIMQPGEALVKAADLRPTSIIYGPANEDPFLTQQTSEDETMFRQRLRRRVITSAETRDGVEIVPNIIVEYRVKGVSDPTRNPYGFDQTYARQALRQDYLSDKSNVDSELDSDLNRLPAELAVQAWRTYVNRFSLLELFSPFESQNLLQNDKSSFGLHQVISHVNHYLTRQYVNEIGKDGLPTGGQILSEAYNELEHAGLKVIRVWIVNLHIDPQHEAAFIRQWIASWPQLVKNTDAAINARHQEMEAANRQKAVMDFVKAAMGPLREGIVRYGALPEQFLFNTRSLHLLALGTRSLSGLDAAQKFKLDQLIDWLEGNLE